VDYTSFDIIDPPVENIGKVRNVGGYRQVAIGQRFEKGDDRNRLLIVQAKIADA
jgi:hypothetical protein